MNFFDGLNFNMFGSEPHSVGHVHNEPRYYGIQFNYSGSFYLQIDKGERFEVSGSYVFLTYPGYYFEYGPGNGLSRHHNYICTHGPRIQRYIDGGLWTPDMKSPLIPVAHPEKFLRMMLDIMTIIRQPGPVSPRAVLMFEDLLLQIREFSQEDHRHIPYQIEKLKRLTEDISNSPEQEWNFETEAKKMHITPTHFRRIFKEITDLPPQQFLLQMRLKRAAELLKFTTLPVKEIANLSGWENVFYFSRLFRQKYHISPRQYRNEFYS